MKDIAIIGLSGRFPEARNLAEFRQNLIQGKDSVRDFSFERRSATTIPFEKEFLGIGYLEEVDQFDHKFFNISKLEAENMDPHQRLLLEVVYEAIENAGYNVDFFHGTETAVFIGDTDQEYHRLAEQFDPTLITGTTSATTAGRISRFFNLRGNAAMVDTACSSSLVAVHLACNELATGDADYALACGVRLILFPEEKNTNPDLGIMSPDGKTKSFSARADGSGSGEAVGCVLLKPLDKALADGDLIYAVIKGSAVNQDAQLSGSLTAPSSQAQAEVIKKSWKKAGIDPLSISYIETHGSGTKLGDPIEIAGIDLAYKGLTTDKHFCAVSALKSNIGHTGSAAGISGLIKAVLSLKHQELYPSLHYDLPNPFIDFKNSVVYVNNVYKPWEATFPRRAGVSSFGLSGTNCHVLLEEAPISTTNNAHTGSYLFNLSAKSAGNLTTAVEDFKTYLNNQDDTTLPAISYTLNRGRKHYAHRIAVIASTKAELIEKISQAKGSTTAGPLKKIIFIFSGDSSVSDQLLAGLALKHPELKKYIDECAAFYTVSNPAINRFTLQYTLYRFLEAKGIITENLLGIGSGDLVVATILEEMTLQDAIGECTDEAAPEDLTARLNSLVDREAGDDKVAFIEIGTPGALSKGLQQLDYPDQEFLYSVITMEHDPLEIIQTLYLQQYPINWDKYYGKNLLSKVKLPTYSFEKIRCWLKEPLKQGEQATTDTVAKPAACAVPATSVPGRPVDPEKLRAIIDENWSDMEKKIAAIWIETLKVEELSLEDDFFRLGGHSLMATKVIATIEKDFGIKLVFNDIFTFATVKSLAKGVETLLANGQQKTTYREIQPADQREYYPLSEAQLRLWLIDQMNEDTTAYNLPSALMMEGNLDIKNLEATFRKLINRHESLRTSFHEENAEPVQVIHEQVDFIIEQFAATNNLEALMKSFFKPFDLTQAPLLRVGLVTLTPERYLLLFDIHHIISDGVSQALFTNELITLYDHEALPPLKIQYKDFVVWQKELFEQGLMQAHEDFWLQRFASGVPLLQLKTDKPRPAFQTFEGDRLLFELPKEQVQQIQQMAASTGTTPFMFLLAVYNVLLHKYTGQEDIVVGTPIAGRSHEGLNQIIGMFVNTLVMRNQPAPEKTFIQFLEEVKGNSLNAYEHQDYPFVLLVQKLDLRKESSRNPLFDVMFVLQNIDIPDMTLSDMTVTDYPMDTGVSQFDLLMEINESPENWLVKLEYNTALFEPESILLMKERFLALLEDIFINATKPIAGLSARIAAETIAETSGLDADFDF